MIDRNEPMLKALAWDDEDKWMGKLKEHLLDKHIELTVVDDPNDFQLIFDSQTWSFVILDIFEEDKPVKKESKKTGLYLMNWIKRKSEGKLIPVFIVTKEWERIDPIEFETFPEKVFVKSKNAGVAWIADDIVEQLKEPGFFIDIRKVFIAHGRTDHYEKVARYLEHLNLKPVILKEQVGSGMTIIEKLENYSFDVCYVIIIMTPDDIGGLAGEECSSQPRARENVIFELGYFAGKFGRGKVAVLNKGANIPSNYSGIEYIEFGEHDDWKIKLAKEMKAAGLKVDMNKIT